MEHYVYIYLDTRKPGKYVYNDLEFDYEPFYVGQGTKYRCISGLKNGGSFYKRNKINKIFNDGFKPKLLKLYENITYENAIEKEIEIISKIGRNDLGKGPLVNLTDGGEGTVNISPEIIKKRAKSQIGRKLSYKLRKTTNELYTATSPLSDADYQKVTEEAEKIKRYPIYYVDTPGTVDEVNNTINVFRSLHAKDKWLIIMYDHTLLTKPKGNEGERETIVALQRIFNEQKKVGKTTIIQLTQLNREIESEGRITNPSMHFPQRKDISTSDAVYQISDLVIVLHRPEILGIRSYGPANWPVENMIYCHCIKVREGEPKILPFTNNLKYNSLEEYLVVPQTS